MARVGVTEAEIDALTAAVFGEAQTEGPLGMRAVIDTILNRTSSPSFPNTILGVVTQHSQIDAIAGPDINDPIARISELVAAAPAATRAVVEQHLARRSTGVPSTIGRAVNYARHDLAGVTPNNQGWVNDLTRAADRGVPDHEIVGAHVFGIVPGNRPAAEYQVNLNPAQPDLVTAIGRSLQQDMAGPDVADLQAALNAMGFDAGPVDSQFGPQTARAVAAAQAAMGMQPTGTVTPQTAAAFGFALGNIGLDVTSPTPTVQADVPGLGQAGLPDVVDPGLFDPSPAMGQRAALGFGTPPSFDFAAPDVGRPAADIDFSLTPDVGFTPNPFTGPGIGVFGAPAVPGLDTQFAPTPGTTPGQAAINAMAGRAQTPTNRQQAPFSAALDPSVSPSLGFASQLGATGRAFDPATDATMAHVSPDFDPTMGHQPDMLDVANIAGMGFGQNAIAPTGFSPVSGPGTARSQPAFDFGRPAQARTGTLDDPGLGFGSLPGIDLAGFNQEPISLGRSTARADAIGLAPEAIGSLSADAPAALGMGRAEAMGLGPASQGDIALSEPMGLQGASAQAGGVPSADAPSGFGIGMGGIGSQVDASGFMDPAASIAAGQAQSPSIDWGSLASARHDIAPTMDPAVGIPNAQTLSSLGLPSVTPSVAPTSRAEAAPAAPEVAGVLDTPGFTPSAAPAAQAAPSSPFDGPGTPADLDASIDFTNMPGFSPPSFGDLARGVMGVPDVDFSGLPAVTAPQQQAKPQDRPAIAAPPAAQAVAEPIAAPQEPIQAPQEIPTVKGPQQQQKSPAAPPSRIPTVQAPLATVATPLTTGRATAAEFAPELALASHALGQHGTPLGNAIDAGIAAGMAQGRKGGWHSGVALDALAQTMDRSTPQFAAMEVAAMKGPAAMAEMGYKGAPSFGGFGFSGFGSSAGADTGSGGVGGVGGSGRSGNFGAAATGIAHGVNTNPGQGNIGADPDSAQGFATGQGGEPGSAGGEGSVLCTAFHRMGWIPRPVWRANSLWSLKNVDQQTYRAYRWWADPLLRAMKKHPWLRKPVFRLIVRPWALEAAHRANPDKHPETRWWRRAHMAAFLGANRLLGRMLSTAALAAEFFDPKRARA